MQQASVSGFWAMGGFAAYVWPAFGFAALVMIVLAVVSRRQLALRQRLLDRLEATRPRRPRAGSKGDIGNDP